MYGAQKITSEIQRVLYFTTVTRRLNCNSVVGSIVSFFHWMYVSAIPLPDPRTPPQVYFFDVVGQANTLFHLFEKQFMDSLVPLVM